MFCKYLEACIVVSLHVFSCIAGCLQRHHPKTKGILKLICFYVSTSISIIMYCVFQQLSHVRLFVTPWTAVCQASLSITNSWSLLKLTSIESVMPSNHVHPLLSPYPPAFSLTQHQGFFQSVGSLHQVAKVLVLQLQHQSFQIIFRVKLEVLSMRR